VYQAAVSVANVNLTTTMNAAQAAHDQAVAALQDANNASQSAAQATLQSAMAQLNAAYTLAIAAAGASRDEALAVIGDSESATQQQLKAGTQTTLQQAFATWRHCRELLTNDRVNESCTGKDDLYAQIGIVAVRHSRGRCWAALLRNRVPKPVV
jgi:hypothetical protein